MEHHQENRVNENIRNREFIGQGLAFPLQVNPRGAMALASGERDIEQAIRIILPGMVYRFRRTVDLAGGEREVGAHFFTHGPLDSCCCIS